MTNKFIELLKNLKSEDWNKKVNDSWTVKDVIAHMVGWEEECVNQLPVIWNTKQTPWFLDETKDDAFNKHSLEKFKQFSPEQLITEWEKWLEKGKETVSGIGEENMKNNPKLFGWWFDDSHNKSHYDQVRKAV